MAAEKIGAETVTYVGNIYKYYIAYKLVMEQMQLRQQASETLKRQEQPADKAPAKETKSLEPPPGVWKQQAGLPRKACLLFVP